MSLEIHLTEDAADFAARLRGEFTSGKEEPRYRPQAGTSFNALIADFLRNLHEEKIAQLKPTAAGEEIHTRTARYLVKKGLLKRLENLATRAGYTLPDSADDETYQRIIAEVVEKIIRQYRAPVRWRDARSLVKEHVVEFSFLKDQSYVGFDVPETDWAAFARRHKGRNEKELLLAMDKHIQATCQEGPEKLRAFFKQRADEVRDIQEHVRNTECRFVVLRLGEDCKTTLRIALHAGGTRFEPYLVLLLRPPSSKKRAEKN